MMHLDIRLVLITPSTARAFLVCNYKNRPVRQEHVDRMAQDMRRGFWRSNGESIKLDDRGQLVDGQHRLLAVIAADVSVEMLVVRNCDPRSIDTGKKKTVADYLAMQDRPNANALAATIAKVSVWLAGDFNALGRAGQTITNDEALDVLNANPEIASSVDFVSALRGGKGFFPTSEAALCFFVFAAIDKAKAQAFFDALFVGANLDEFSPIFRLRQRCLQNQNNRASKLTTVMRVALTIKAWNAWRQSRSVKVLGFNPNEPFPEPL